MTEPAPAPAPDAVGLPPPLLRTADVCAVLRLSPRSVRSLVQQGQLRAVRVSRYRLRFTRAAVEDFVRGAATGGNGT